MEIAGKTTFRLTLNLNLTILTLFLLGNCHPPVKHLPPPDTTSGLYDTKWVLVELNGAPIDTSLFQRGLPNFTLNEDEQQILGFGGCNTFFGTIHKGPADGLSFDKIESTLMACEKSMGLEAAFLKVLEKTDSYALSGNRLSLHMARMATLAILEAAPEN